MTRKDFELLARSIREQRELHAAMDEPIGFAAISEYAQHLARDLRDEHPRFNADTFLAACEPRDPIPSAAFIAALERINA